MLALVCASIGGLFRGEWSLDTLFEIGTMVAITGLIAGAILVLIRSLRSPPIRIDAIARVMEVGRGSSRRTVPFADISRVDFGRLSKHSVDGDEMMVFGIDVVLNDGDTLRLGTVSGETAKARERAVEIVRLVTETMGLDGSE
jgi:hypothetical protein